MKPLFLLLSLLLPFTLCDDQITIPITYQNDSPLPMVSLSEGEPSSLDIQKLHTELNKLNSPNKNLENYKKNYGFSLDLNKNILTVGNLFDRDNEEKFNSLHLNEFDIIDDEGPFWQILLKGFFIGNIDTSNKHTEGYEEQKRQDGSIEKVFIVPKSYKGAEIEEMAISLETVHNEIYVEQKFLDFLENNGYFKDGEKNLCTKKEIGEYICNKEDAKKLLDINLLFEDDLVLRISGEDLIICKDNKDECEFALKTNPKVEGYALGLKGLKNVKSYFMINDESIYMENYEGYDEGKHRLFKVTLKETDYDVLGAKIKKKIRKAFAELFRTIIVILGLFLILFIFFFIHQKFWGDKYLDKKEDDKEKELVEQ